MNRDQDNYLPVSRADMDKRRWEQLDFLLISGDAYVDHPSFATALIGRVLEARGYKVGLICQPDWRSTSDFKKLGKPRLGVLITAGNLDSMLNKYTAAKKIRANDAYSPGGKAGLRPDRATIVYGSRIREIWKKIPIIIGGVEASLRRWVHYDYWSDSLRRPILFDSWANLLIYGMGEKAIVEVADLLAGGMPISDINFVRGTMVMQTAEQVAADKSVVFVPSWETIQTEKRSFAEAFRLQAEQQDPFYGKRVAQEVEGRGFAVQNPPVAPLTEAEMDAIYDLPYQRDWHPMYDAAGGVPAIAEVKFSLVSHRGCFGSCSFCAIHSHQGRIIQARSHQSILREATILTKLPDFKGYIHDVGGPTANFRRPACRKQLKVGACANRQCLLPQPCPAIETDHSDYLSLLRKVRQIPGVKKVFIRSGIRYDYLLLDKKNDFLRELCHFHVSGQLKVAPEHASTKVLQLMGKPSRGTYDRFREAFAEMNRKVGKEQYLVPYFISSHPGSSLQDAIELAEYLRDIKHSPEQVQDFIPTPGSLSTAMYFSEVDPYTGKRLYVAKNLHDKAMQRALLQYRNPRNHSLVREALQKAGRVDLIGNSPKCLVPSEKNTSYHKNDSQGAHWHGDKKRRSSSVAIDSPPKANKYAAKKTGRKNKRQT